MQQTEKTLLEPVNGSCERKGSSAGVVSFANGSFVTKGSVLQSSNPLAALAWTYSRYNNIKSDILANASVIYST